jgi:hypothetical protein
MKKISVRDAIIRVAHKKSRRDVMFIEAPRSFVHKPR